MIAKEIYFLMFLITKSDKINNYWNVKAIFYIFFSKSTNSFKAW